MFKTRRVVNERFETKRFEHNDHRFKRIRASARGHTLLSKPDGRAPKVSPADGFMYLLPRRER